MRTFFKGRFLVAILSNVQPKLLLKLREIFILNFNQFYPVFS